MFDSFVAIALANPAHQFFFITANDPSLIPLPVNAKTLLVKQQTKSSLLWKIWYDYKLPAALRKINADVLVSADGICSLRTRIPQCLIVNDTMFLHHPDWYGKKYLGFIKSNIVACLQKADTAITFSNYSSNELITQYKTAANKIAVIIPGASKIYQPVAVVDREAVKEKYAAGKEYFLFYGAIHEHNHLIRLLKAFSLFKKRQKSSMQLIIATDIIPEKDAFVESLRMYKYRNELTMLAVADDTELHSITAAAYCCINISPLHSDIQFLQNALRCEVPVIAGGSLQAEEILGAAALYAEPTSHESIAAQMMLVFKDENKRDELVKKGIEQSAVHSHENFTRELLQKILAAASR